MKRFLLTMGALVTPALVFAQETTASAGGLVSALAGNGIKYVAAAVAVGVGCVSGAIAVGQIGAAAMGAMSENPEVGGKAMPFVGLAEGICLWGFLVALLILVL